MDSNFEPKIVAFVCNWCTYTGADLAGTSRMQYASNVRIVKLPCTGRISPLFVVRALAQGADGVLVSGCHPGDCHYTAGNYHARRKYTVLRELLLFLGVEPERVQFSWVSAAEGKKWADVVNEVVAGVRRLGPRVEQEGRGAGEQGSRGAGVVSVAPSSPTLPLSHSAPPAFEAQAAKLRAQAKELLEKGDVRVVVGYGDGLLPGIVRPLFVTSPEGAEQLVWDERCRQNLGVYLTRSEAKKLGKIGLVVKGCDERSVVGLLQENQLAREDVVLLGMACPGVRENGAQPAKCAGCEAHTPSFADHVIGTAEAAVASDPRLGEIAALEAMPAADRWSYWQKQFDRCLKCYACRAACPSCYCERCIADKTQPRWIQSQADADGSRSWHAVRALHLAGRCADCGACTQACPAGIRMDLLNRKLAQVVRDAFDYTPGRDPSVAPPLTMFREDDGQEFIR